MVGMLIGAERVAAGGSHSCALRTSGALVCWGRNDRGQLGDGTIVERHAPVATGLTDVVLADAGGSHTCALRATGQVVCWGSNASGQLGDGSVTMRTVPVTVTGL
jgi:alpha-tubulin suppressor-like RCC1 family protein